jgi:hypothetical protein
LEAKSSVLAADLKSEVRFRGKRIATETEGGDGGSKVFRREQDALLDTL